MIQAARYSQIRQKHGSHGSWAVWAPISSGAKSEVGNLDVLDERKNPALLDTLNPEIIMVGLNLGHGSTIPDKPFRNFHSDNPRAHDFKIRYAFSGTAFWGAYMTDLIKRVVEPVSGNLVAWLKRNPEVVAYNIKVFRAELSDIGCRRPVILAFGWAVHDLLFANLGAEDDSQLVRLTHYSHRVSKETYRDLVHEQLYSLEGQLNVRLQRTALA